jgi:hypothetical protein
LSARSACSTLLSRTMICINSRHNPSKAWNSVRRRQSSAERGPLAAAHFAFKASVRVNICDEA